MASEHSETPGGMTSYVPAASTRIIRQGDSQTASRALHSNQVAANVTSYKRVAALAGSRALLDVASAAAALLITLSLIGHGGSLGPIGPVASQLDAVSAALAACSTLLLIAWRRLPLGVFALTSVAC